MKETLSSLDIYALGADPEFTRLRDAYLSKVYQPTRQEILVRFNRRKSDEELAAAPRGRYAQEELAIVVGSYLCLTVHRRPNPAEPSNFAMLLRKHLQNGRVLGFEQHDFDRVLKLVVEKAHKRYELVIELFHDGNIILVKDGTIVQPLRAQSWSHREVRTGRPYIPPPPRPNPVIMDHHTFEEMLRRSDRDLVRTLILTVNTGGTLGEELCHRANLDKNTDPSTLEDSQIRDLFDHMNAVFETVRTEPDPRIVYPSPAEASEDDGSPSRTGNDDEPVAAPIDITPIPFVRYATEAYRTEPAENFNAAIDHAYRAPIDADTPQMRTKQRARKARSAYEQQIGALERTKVQQERAIERFGAKIEENGAKADAIYANYKQCESILRVLRDAKERLGLNEMKERVKETDQILDLDPRQGTVIVPLTAADDPEQTFKVRLDLNEDINASAQYYYERAKRLKNKCEGAQRALEDTLKKIETMRASGPPKLEVVRKQPSKHFWFENYRWFIASTDNIVVAGRDAQTNDRVVNKYLEDHDRYAHADIHGAPSVVVKKSDDEDAIAEAALQQACQFSVCYSKAWRARIAAASAYWVKPEQVSKTPEAGEFLAKGAFIVRGKRNYVRHLPLELGIGLVEVEHVPKVMGGPVAAVKHHAEQFVVVQPGTTPRETVAKQLARQFESGIEALQAVLPPGDLRVVQSKGVNIEE